MANAFLIAWSNLEPDAALSLADAHIVLLQTKELLST
jgi:hypothetical protein